MKIVFRRFENITPEKSGLPGVRNMKIKDYEFDNEIDAWNWISKQLEDFKIKNSVKDETKDKAFIRYKCELFDSIASQVTEQKDDYDHCKSCPEEDWEGTDKMFCRCEDRNMRIARVKRMKLSEVYC